MGSPLCNESAFLSTPVYVVAHATKFEWNFSVNIKHICEILDILDVNKKTLQKLINSNPC